ncbi:hypothetical protein O6H91_Y330400 [Diphasiastrum complanatum]|nr:hypothetical protein O6H91_Y330400 [Diphasiastrum complanatum]
MRKLLHLHDRISYWRAKIITNSREWEGVNKALRDQKEDVNKHYQDLKKKLERMCKSEHDKLKMETSNKKTFPFDPFHYSTIFMMPEDTMEDLDVNKSNGTHEGGKSATNTNEKEYLVVENRKQVNEVSNAPKIEKNESMELSSSAIDKNGNQVAKWNYFCNFHKCYNKVLLDKLALELERHKFVEENARLQSTLQRYLDGITVNDNVMKGPLNTLLIINGQVSDHLSSR